MRTTRFVCSKMAVVGILSIVLLMLLGHQTVLCQINFPLAAGGGCNEVPPQCRCIADVFDCDCLDQDVQRLVLELKNIESGGLQKRAAIRNCRNVTIRSGTFRNSSIHALRLANITELTLEPSALQLDQDHQKRFTLIMTDVTTRTLPQQMFSSDNSSSDITGAPRANTPKVNFQMNNSHVGIASSEVFGNIRIHDLMMEGNTIGQLQTGFLNNTVEGVISIQRNIFNAVQRDAFIVNNAFSLPRNLLLRYNNFTESLAQFVTAEVDSNIKVSNNSFPVMLEAPWRLTAREDIVVDGNHFTNLPSGALALSAGARISFSYNIVDFAKRQAFMAINTQSQSTLLQIVQNRFNITEEGSLQLPDDLTSDIVVVRSNVFEESCNCNISNSILRAIVAAANVDQSDRKDHLLKPWVQKSLCRQQGNPEQQYIPVWQYYSRNCVVADTTTTVFLATFGAIMIVLACYVIVTWRRLKKKHLAATHSSTIQPQFPEGELTWSRVIPNQQAYREAEIQVLFEKARTLERVDSEELPYMRCYRNEAIVEHDTDLIGQGTLKLYQKHANSVYQQAIKNQKTAHTQVGLARQDKLDGTANKSMMAGIPNVMNVANAKLAPVLEEAPVLEDRVIFKIKK
ncbi:uncharacterized protein LOC108676636 [Hyalella azteca]|uniref:Uncharacterized protein LOC108676636 n=1 Tax=Hyalella azteca TaxID=294128 RepID=A0A8B7P581_HYAAZ|nr:uncharacterized protein LOC108676636 [Hyalella azteca]